MQQFNITVDGYSALLCIVLAVYVLISGDRRDRANLCFAGICLCNAAMALGDITAWLYTPPLDPVQYAVMLAGSFLFFAAPAPLFLFFTGYIVAFLQKRIEVPRNYLLFAIALFALYLIGCVISLFNGMFFGVDPGSGYYRGPLFLLAQVVPLVLHVRNAFIIVRHRSCLNRKEQLAFFGYILLPLIAEAIQVAWFGIALMNTAVALAVLIVFLNIQSERKALLERRDRELAEARASIMMSQIQPHFLYNTLTAIRELCRSDPARAAQTVTDFAQFLRENMASLTSKTPIPFERELRHTETYLSLERERFGDRLRVEYAIDARNFSLPPLSMQVLVENAVRHGVTPRETGGCVMIASAEDEHSFCVTVSDDGIGFDLAVPPDADGGTHVGIANVRTRLAESCCGTLEVCSVPGGGTTATIRIPKDGERVAAASRDLGKPLAISDAKGTRE